MVYRISILWVFIFQVNLITHAHNYHEHRRLGNLAFNHAITRVDWPFLNQYLSLRYDSISKHWYFNGLSKHPNQVSYGTLTALAGDHAGSPIQLIDNLQYSYSKLNRIILLQDEYGQQFFTNANDGKLYKTDKTYGTLALNNFDHFYYYGKSFTQHIAGVQKELILQLLNPAQEEEAMKALEKTNAIEAYISLHAAAVQLAEQAGVLVKNGETAKGQQVLFYALIFNAFADHFLQDAFAAGHLIVKRRLLASITNNKAMHDFYNQVGLEVCNLKGEIWKTNGDDKTFLPDRNWETNTSYADIATSPEDSLTKVQKVVAAVETSILEVFGAFDYARVSGGTNWVAKIPGKEQAASAKETFYLHTFKALSLLPIPFSSQMKKYGFTGEKLTSLQAVNRIPFYRSYIRSRVSHSLTLGIGRRLGQLSKEKGTPPIYPMELRYRVGMGQYTYHDKPRKIGTFDHWQGIGVAYLFGGQPIYGEGESELLDFNTVHQVKVGYNQITDFWFTNNSFIGVHRSLETGVDIREGKPAWIVSPSVGLQLFPFAAGIKKTTFSKAGTFLLRALVGQRFLFSYQFITAQRSQFYISTEFDISF